MVLTFLAVFVCIYLILDRLMRIPKVGGYGNKHVFVTGCDSGFGRDLALRLDTLGFPVFAGCLTESGCQALSKISSSRLRTVKLDVTNTDSIRDAEKFVREKMPEDSVLWGVVNNAGVTGPISMLEMSTRQDMIDTCQVNLFGPAEMTRVFLPLLRQSRGRVVSTGSVMGRCPAAPGPYAASKFGMEAFSDVLRREIAPFGVKVCLVEPGYYRTPLLDLDALGGKIEKSFLSSTPEVKAAYGGPGFVDRMKALFAMTVEQSSRDTYKVVDALADSLTARYPRARYVVGWDARYLFVPLSYVPEWVGDAILGWIQAYRLRERGFAS